MSRLILPPHARANRSRMGYDLSRKPEEHFLRALASKDRDLRCVWNRDIERWCIQRKSARYASGWAHIMVIKNDDGSYRPPDQRTIDHLNKIDSWRFYGTGWRDFIERELDEGSKGPAEEAAETRYFDLIGDLTDRWAWMLKRDPKIDSFRTTGHREELKALEERAERESD